MQTDRTQGLRRPRHTAAQRRTTALLSSFAGNRDELMMLKGVLCMAHGLEGTHANLAASVFDTAMIAARMDAINAETLAVFNARKGQ